MSKLRSTKKDQIISLKLPAELIHQFDREAAHEGLSRSAVMRRALMEKYRCEPAAVGASA